MTLKYEFDDCEYEYKVDVDDVLIKQFAWEFKIDEEAAESIIEEFDLYYTLEDRYIDEITEFFEREAYEQYKDDLEYDRNTLEYYGMSERDFY